MIVWFSKLSTLVSQAANALILGGNVDESVSGRAHRESWRIERWIDALFFWKPGHCKRAHETDVAFARMILKVP